MSEHKSSAQGRSPEAQEYRAWYKTYRWQQKRKRQLEAEPLCAICAKHGRVTVATVADHLIPHKGNPQLFWGGKLQSLCDEAPWRCHSSVKQSEERSGKPRPRIGADGWPVESK